jgi:beta-glucosidase
VADVEGLLARLTLEEKASLTAGEDMFSLVGVDRVGLPKVRLTDGPAGAKWMSGVGIGGDPSTWIPCESAIGATWDPPLAERLGALVAKEALHRGCRVLLAPTVNLHRSPLAGRDFECFSEDPLLSGRLAVGYVSGVQAQGVLATVKHFVGNEAEFERTTISSVIDERTLRELYLLPFELAVREGRALGIMTGYNRLNGSWVTEQPDLLLSILRDEWGFQGLVMTDWHGVVNAATSLGAGLDLEMPGPARGLGANVLASINDGLLDKADLDAAVRRLLWALDRVGALDAATPPVSPQPPSESDIALVRAAAADATVLLSNDGVLPLDPALAARVADIGELAIRSSMGGGGSAQLIPHRYAAPLDALRSALEPTTAVAYERGCDMNRAPARVGGPALPAPGGFTVEVFAGADLQGQAVSSRSLEDLLFIYNGAFSEGYPTGEWSVRATGRLVPDSTGTRRVVLANSAPTRVYVDGALIVDGTDREPPTLSADTSWLASEELFAEVHLTAGVPVDLVVEYVHSGAPVGAFRVGVRDNDEDALMERAVEAARASDVAVVFVGTSHEYESEGYDRTSFSLPARQDELVRRVAAVNPRTVVVVNSGTVVDMPWAEDVAAVLQVWFGGQEMDGAIADVLTGRAEPGGRLPVTIPQRLEHCPSHGNFPGENGEVRYGEGLFMGYRGYEHRAIEPRFAFGHGLSYTTFEVGEPELSDSLFREGRQLRVRIPVTNTGSRSGSEVVQLYVAPRAACLSRPHKELKGFAKVRLEPGESGVAEIVLDDRSFAYWDNGRPDYELMRARVRSHVEVPAGTTADRRGWRVDPGAYDLLIGTSSSRIVSRATVVVAE